MEAVKYFKNIMDLFKKVPNLNVQDLELIAVELIDNDFDSMAQIKEKDPALYTNAIELISFSIHLASHLNDMEPFFQAYQVNLIEKAFSVFKEIETNDKSVAVLVDCIKEEIAKDEKPVLYRGLEIIAEDYLRNQSVRQQYVQYISEVRGVEKQQK